MNAKHTMIFIRVFFFLSETCISLENAIHTNNPQMMRGSKVKNDEILSSAHWSVKHRAEAGSIENSEIIIVRNIILFTHKL
jgi:hypothetical protein